MDVPALVDVPVLADSDTNPADSAEAVQRWI